MNTNFESNANVRTPPFTGCEEDLRENGMWKLSEDDYDRACRYIQSRAIHYHKQKPERGYDQSFLAYLVSENKWLWEKKWHEVVVRSNSGLNGIRSIVRKPRYGPKPPGFTSKLRSILKTKTDTEKRRLDQMAINLESFQFTVDKRTNFMIEIDAVLKEKFGIPKLSNEEANNAAMRDYLNRFMKNHHKSMRRVDMQKHVESAITRAYMPHPNETKLVAIRRAATYKVVNGAYHGEKDLQVDIGARTLTKWTRIKRLLFGEPAQARLEKHELNVLKNHSIKHTPLDVVETNEWLPEQLGQLDPLYSLSEETDSECDDDWCQEEETQLEQEDESDVNTTLSEMFGKISKKKKKKTKTDKPLPEEVVARGPNNAAPGGTITTLEQC